MLQINTGKFFRDPEVRTNELRGILYSNIQLSRYATGVSTLAGALRPTDSYDDQALIYELTERIEGGVAAAAVVSHMADPYLEEFATLASFGLNATLTRDRNLLQRLIAPLSGSARDHDRPAAFVRRAFDLQIHLQDQEATAFAAFVDGLLALDRRHYAAASRAIGGYVTGLHQLLEDRDLAYVLLVAALEAMVQGYDGERAAWADYDSTKRKRVDRALTGAADDVREKVRDAVLANEHVALARRFRDHTLSRVGPAFFRAEAEGQLAAVGRSDLTAALQQAYRLRSKYLHELRPLPREVTWNSHYGHHEITSVDGCARLTYQGLARLAQHVIRAFVRDGPQVEKEIYDYSLDRAGVMRARLAPEMWIHRTDTVGPTSGAQRLQGFLEQLTPLLAGSQTATLTDIRDLLGWVDANYAELQPAHRRPFAALYILFNGIVRGPERMAAYGERGPVYEADLQMLIIETMVTALVFEIPFEGAPSEQLETFEAYLRERDRPEGFRIPPLLEAALLLEIAEAFRLQCDEPTTRRLITRALEDHPTLPGLQMLETTFDPGTPLRWRLVLTPDNPPPAEPASESQPP